MRVVVSFSVLAERARKSLSSADIKGVARSMRAGETDTTTRLMKEVRGEGWSADARNQETTKCLPVREGIRGDGQWACADESVLSAGCGMEYEGKGKALR